MQKNSFIKGAVIISLGGFISKILGAVYRIPLTNILGGEGMGIYQMVYPLYCILLTVSASGIPTGIARLISSGKSGAEKTAFKLYGAIGVIGTVFMYFLSEPLSVLQGEPAVSVCCKMLCPSVFFVSVLSVIRGYFQGSGNMYPTAFTEVGEQVIKVALGVVLAYNFRENLTRSVASTLFAVTISEAVATFFAFLYYLKRRPRLPLYRARRPPAKAVLRYTVPLTLTAVALPLSQLAESVVSVRLLGGVGTGAATALYGIYSGCAVTIINLPVSVTYGLAASSVPQISPLAEAGNFPAAKKKAFKALLITFFVSLPAAIGLFALAPLAANIIFGSLPEEQKALLIGLVRVMSLCSVTQSLVQTSSACLTALGKPALSTGTQWASAILRVLLTAALIKFTSLGIYGAAWSAEIANLLATALNICYIICAGEKHEDNFDRIGNMRRRPNPPGEAGA